MPAGECVLLCGEAKPRLSFGSYERVQQTN